MKKNTQRIIIAIAVVILLGMLSFILARTWINIKQIEKRQNATKIVADSNKIDHFEGRSQQEFSIKIDADRSILRASQSDFNINTFATHENYKYFNKRCGLHASSIYRIEGGQNAELFEFPWLVALLAQKDFGELKYFCGGSLISEQLVLTAAHCVDSLPEGYKIIVRLGEYNLKADPDCKEADYCADPIQDFYHDDYSVVIHSQYNRSTEYNDIALVKLKKPANITQNNIKLLCLPFNQDDIHERTTNEKMVVIGFGLHENSSTDSDTSSVMLKGVVDHIDNKKCMGQYGEAFKTRPLTKKQFCAAGKNKKQQYVDTCKGDSGSPIFVFSTSRSKRDLSEEDYSGYSSLEYDNPENENFNASSSQSADNADLNRDNVYVQQGIVSFGERKICGEGSRPGIYTNVHHYLMWILDNARPE